MSALNDTYQELQQHLIRLEDQCEAISIGLNAFNSHASLYAGASLISQLIILGVWITTRAYSLREQYNDQGYARVLVQAGCGFIPDWVPNKPTIVAPKPWHNTQGVTILSLQEALNIIIRMANELASGNWATLMDWWREYGKSPELDFDKFSHSQVMDSVSQDIK